MANCLGNEYESGCGVYSGPAIPSLDIETGDPLNDVLFKIANANTSMTTSAVASITSDNVVSKSLIRTSGSSCSTAVTKRDFTYTITNTDNSTTFSWDMLGVISALPDDYDAVLTKVKAVGRPNSQGNTVITNSTKPSAGFSIGLDRYPVSVDFTLRITASCGDIDLQRTIYLASASETGTKRVVLDVDELSTTPTEDISLTDQLNKLEATVSRLDIKVDSMDSVNVAGATSSVNTAVSSQQAQIEGIEQIIADPTNLDISYFDDSNKTAALGSVITELFATLNAYQADRAAMQTEINSLKSQVASLNSIS